MFARRKHTRPVFKRIVRCLAGTPYVYYFVAVVLLFFHYFTSSSLLCVCVCTSIWDFSSVCSFLFGWTFHLSEKEKVSEWKWRESISRVSSRSIFAVTAAIIIAHVHFQQPFLFSHVPLSCNTFFSLSLFFHLHHTHFLEVKNGEDEWERMVIPHPLV